MDINIGEERARYRQALMSVAAFAAENPLMLMPAEMTRDLCAGNATGTEHIAAARDHLLNVIEMIAKGALYGK